MHIFIKLAEAEAECRKRIRMETNTLTRVREERKKPKHIWSHTPDLPLKTHSQAESRIKKNCSVSLCTRIHICRLVQMPFGVYTSTHTNASTNAKRPNNSICFPFVPLWFRLNGAMPSRMIHTTTMQWMPHFINDSILWLSIHFVHRHPNTCIYAVVTLSCACVCVCVSKMFENYYRTYVLVSVRILLNCVCVRVCVCWKAKQMRGK